MQVLSPLSRLQFHGNRPTLIYSKLSFHNKILLIIFLLLLLFGLVGAIALQWALKVHLIKEYENHFQTITDSLSHHLVSMVSLGDRTGVKHLLSEENKLYGISLYMIVTDKNGETLGQSLNRE
ncbi:MAG: hypothetical protein FD151_2126, partial [bacterium]